jgi:hypothetical protein
MTDFPQERIRMTLEEFMALPETTQPTELIDGESVDRNQAVKGMSICNEKPCRCFTIAQSHKRQRAKGSR